MQCELTSRNVSNLKLIAILSMIAILMKDSVVPRELDECIERARTGWKALALEVMDLFPGGLGSFEAEISRLANDLGIEVTVLPLSNVH